MGHLQLCIGQGRKNDIRTRVLACIEIASCSFEDERMSQDGQGSKTSLDAFVHTTITPIWPSYRVKVDQAC